MARVRFEMWTSCCYRPAQGSEGSRYCPKSPRCPTSGSDAKGSRIESIRRHAHRPEPPLDGRPAPRPPTRRGRHHTLHSSIGPHRQRGPLCRRPPTTAEWCLALAVQCVVGAEDDPLPPCAADPPTGADATRDAMAPAGTIDLPAAMPEIPIAVAPRPIADQEQP